MCRVNTHNNRAQILGAYTTVTWRAFRDCISTLSLQKHLAALPAEPTYLLGAISTMPYACRPEKRQRTSSPSIDENSVFVRSTVWYDDGSVVLQAECTQFRVHRTLLCQNSTIFTDMFSIPQPSQEESLVEGCPLVRLSDSAEEVETVLRALYFHTYVCSFPAVPL